MVATETRRVYWTDGDYRTAVERFMEQRLWSVQRLAADMAVTVDQLNTWLDGDVASTKLRQRLVRLVEGWQIPHPRANDGDADDPDDSDAVPDTKPFDYIKGAASAPKPDESIVRATFPPRSGFIEIPAPAAEAMEDPIDVELVFPQDEILPSGFAMLVPVPLPARGHPPALILRDKCVAISKPLRASLGDARYVVFGIESRTDESFGEPAIALAVVTGDSKFMDHAYLIPKNSEWASTVRNSIGLPNGVYVAQLAEGYGSTWVCRRTAQ